MCFLPLKSSHYPSRPVPVPELFGKYLTRPIPKSKTPTCRPWSQLELGPAKSAKDVVQKWKRAPDLKDRIVKDPLHSSAAAAIPVDFDRTIAPGANSEHFWKSVIIGSFHRFSATDSNQSKTPWKSSRLHRNGRFPLWGTCLKTHHWALLSDEQKWWHKLMHLLSTLGKDRDAKLKPGQASEAAMDKLSRHTLRVLWHIWMHTYPPPVNLLAKMARCTWSLASLTTIFLTRPNFKALSTHGVVIWLSF